MSGKNPSDETKLKQKRCQGEGLDYIPWIKANEFSSTGTAHVIHNWKTGRQTHLLSMGEQYVFLWANFHDNVVDIREQYVLDFEETKEIAKKFGFRPPVNRMSTDLLLTLSEPKRKLLALSVKYSEDSITTAERRRLIIEEEYWKRHDVEYHLLYSSDMNPIFCKNIRTCSKVYLPEQIQDDSMAIKHMIIRKLIDVDMESGNLDYEKLLKEYRNEVNTLYDEYKKHPNFNWYSHESN